MAAREAKADLERRLAVEAEKSSRIPGLERSLVEKTTQVESLVQSKAAADAQVAEKLALLSGKAEAETKLTERLDSSTQALKAAQGEMTGLQSRLATLQEALKQERKQAREKLARLLDAREGMTKEFKLLAEDVMRLNSENFTKQNKEQIELILTPLREKLVEFQQGIKDARTESVKDHATLVEQIRQLTDSSAKMTPETSSLTRALRGEAQTQGAWGEMTSLPFLRSPGCVRGRNMSPSKVTPPMKARKFDLMWLSVCPAATES